MKDFPRVVLKQGKDDAIKRFHPWIFSGAIKNILGCPKEGDVVEVFSNNGDYLGTGHFQTGTITVRVFSFQQLTPDFEFWKSCLQKAYYLRKELGFTDNSETNVYRLVNAEGDNLPGLIIDYYNGSIVIQAHSIGMYLIRDQIAKALTEIYGGKLNTIFDKSSETLSRMNLANSENEFLLGNKVENEVMEYGNKFIVDSEKGQKTGFFIDQRENRKLIERYAKNKKVLNTFCYTGGFSVYALKAGAIEVHSVDSSKKAIELTEKNILLNELDIHKHQSFQLDAMDFLKDIDQKYDLIILDPPAFAKHNSSKRNALQAYKRINLQAIQQIRKSGIIFTFSCSQVVDRNLFYSTVVSAAILSGRNVKIIHQLSQPSDHPLSAFHPEGEYLKGLVLFVE
ncbi:MAG: class I SAM-dependent rRNA methyltransferase [Bacteroidetes bacterium]|nr:class I SAM-dependent rRNA methyltransferase [Bacteroidota bacterium]